MNAFISRKIASQTLPGQQDKTKTLAVANSNVRHPDGFSSFKGNFNLQLKAKRMFDISASAVALIVFLPLFLVIALLIKLDDGGPVLFRQIRWGLHGRKITIYKFRSMPLDAEDASGPIWARDDDPRATQIGRWLRRHDIDELPQFWNVLVGDMSIVGPRPERPFFVEQFKHRIPQYMLRHKVKAGITGWAQVNGWRGNTSLEKRIEFDLYYIENWSLSLDFKIMWLTVLRGFHRLA